MLLFLIILLVVLSLLLVVVLKRFISNKNDIGALYRKLIFLNKELENTDRITTERLNQQSFDAKGISWLTFKFPFLLIDKKKFTCNTYKSAAGDYTSYLRPVIIISSVWILILIAIVLIII